MILRNTIVTLLAALATPVAAQSVYPNRPIRVVIQFPPGGSDTVARILCQKMGESLGQQFVIDNRPGAAGVIGATIVAKAAPDGYTTLFATASFAVTAAFSKKLPYDSIKDFDSIGFIGSQPFILVVHPSVPVNSVKEFIAFAKTQPQNFVSAGTGGIGHLTHELFNNMTEQNHQGSGHQRSVAPRRVSFGVLNICLKTNTYDISVLRLRM